MKRLGLIGCGNMGQFLLRSINHEKVIPGIKITSIFHPRPAKILTIAKTYQAEVLDDFTAFLDSHLDMVVETATIEAVHQYGRLVVENGFDFIAASVGAFSDPDFTAEIASRCQQTGASVYLPSGAIGGLDVVKAAQASGHLDSVTLTTRKPPQALTNQPIREATVIFEGSAKEAIQKFPKNINVSIVLSLAGLGVERTKVKIVADPEIEKNIHQIEAVGAFGKLKVEVENEPMPANPKTSFLAALSLLATLKNMGESVRVGS